MHLDEFLALTENRGRPPTARALAHFEDEIGASLPGDYREFLEQCNGGYVGGVIWFAETQNGQKQPTVGVHHVGGLRRDKNYSLTDNHRLYQVENHWIPRDVLWVMDDPFGNATCVGLRGMHRGKVYFWDHEGIPSAGSWDGRVETARNVRLLASSFADFLAGCEHDAD